MISSKTTLACACTDPGHPCGCDGAPGHPHITCPHPISTTVPTDPAFRVPPRPVKAVKRASRPIAPDSPARYLTGGPEVPEDLWGILTLLSGVDMSAALLCGLCGAHVDAKRDGTAKVHGPTKARCPSKVFTRLERPPLPAGWRISHARGYPDGDSVLYGVCITCGKDAKVKDSGELYTHKPCQDTRIVGDPFPVPVDSVLLAAPGHAVVWENRAFRFAYLGRRRFTKVSEYKKAVKNYADVG